MILNILKFIGIGFVVLTVVGWIGIYFFTNALKSAGKNEEPVIAVLAERTLHNGTKLQFVKTETRRFESGSVFVIPLIPLPIGKKELATNYSFEVLDASGKNLWKESSVAFADETVSILNFALSNDVQWIKSVQRSSGRTQILNLFASPFETSEELIAFIKDNQSLIAKAFNGPISVVVQYAYQKASNFRNEKEVLITMPWPAYLEIFGMPADLKPKGSPSLSLKLKLDDKGLIDLKAEPEDFNKPSTEQRKFLLSTFHSMENFKDENGKSLKSYLLDANSAYLNFRNENN